jgi:hypothetical protein
MPGNFFIRNWRTAWTPTPPPRTWSGRPPPRSAPPRRRPAAPTAALTAAHPRGTSAAGEGLTLAEGIAAAITTTRGPIPTRGAAGSPASPAAATAAAPDAVAAVAATTSSAREALCNISSSQLYILSSYIFFIFVQKKTHKTLGPHVKLFVCVL